MRTYTNFYLLIIIFCLTSCTTSKYTVSKSANLEKYQYASLTNVMDYNGSAALMDLEIQIYDALESTRLTIIGDKEIDKLSSLEKKQLLIVRFSASQNDDESIVSVNFVDYLSGKPIASCRGACGFGLDKNQDLSLAIKRVSKQIQELFKI